jgi:hypothetical protein
MVAAWLGLRPLCVFGSTTGGAIGAAGGVVAVGVGAGVAGLLLNTRVCKAAAGVKVSGMVWSPFV